MIKKIAETFTSTLKLTGRHPGILVYVLFLLLIIGSAFFWRFSPIADHLDVSGIMNWAREITTLPLLIAVSLGAHILAGMTMFPMSVLNTVLALLLGPWKGFALAYGSNIISAFFCYVVFRYLGRRPLQAISGEKIKNLSRKAGERGFLFMIILRNSPMAFGMVNMTAALTHVKFRDYFFGSILGMLPGTLAVCLLAGELKNMVIEPNIFSVVIIVLAIGILFLLYKKMQKKNKQTELPDNLK
ncbi:MAG: VTT domain-containing protein [Desulfovibrionales bacterium]